MRETKAQLVDREPARNPTGVNARVLVIDDEPIIRDVLHDILSREGYVIDSVPDAESGLKALDSGERDLIILDLMLPGIGGFETLRSEEHTSELQSPCNLVCRLLLEKKKKHIVELRTET